MKDKVVREGLRVLQPTATPAASATPAMSVTPAMSAAPEAGAAPEPQLQLDEVRDRLARQGGRKFWRSLDELAQTESFRDMIFREFPRHATEWTDDVSRRNFLQLAGASLALAGLTGCTRQPQERIVSYVEKPEELVPGKPLFFASAVSRGGYSTGVLVESHMGRPTKVEGNPQHPASLGATDVQAQAEVLGLYDPDRSASVRNLGRESTWTAFSAAFASELVAQEALRGEGIRILTESVTSPTLAAQLAKVQERFPEARWHQFEPAGRDAAREGAQLAFGSAAEFSYDIAQADVIVTLDADLLGEGPAHLRYSREFTARRRAVDAAQSVEPNRLYAIESTPTNTGTLADHRLSVRTSEVHGFALALAARLGVAGAAAPASLDDKVTKMVDAVAQDLQAHAGRSLVAAGEYTSPELVALVLAINSALSNLGSTVKVTEPVAVPPGENASLRALVEDLNAGKVDVLVVLDSNPVYSAPADLGFEAAIQKARLRVHWGLYQDETADYCQWHVNAAHFLEGWSDGRAYDGTISVVQPLIEPLYEGRTVHEIVGLLSGDLGFNAYELIEKYWQENWAAWGGEGDPAAGFRRLLHDGLLPGSELPARSVAIDAAGVGAAAQKLAEQAGSATELELVLRPDPSLFDGRYANLGWLQELPRPLTKLTWDNALLISPATVKALGLQGEMPGVPLLPKQLTGDEAELWSLIDATGKMVRITIGEQALDVPLWVQPGQADGVLTLHLGHGRRKAGRVGNGSGFDAYALRNHETPWYAPSVSLEPTGDRFELASTQLHHNIPVESEEAEKRHMVRTATFEEFRADPEVIAHMGHGDLANETIYPGWDYSEGYAWGMVIDLNACTGCNACVVACQAENNIPIVGKQEVINGREMHWIRVDRYFHGEDLSNLEVHNQPVTCMHCEQAPCELVCPVAATVHSDEGLNDMVYNRCVGTRYCSNNCPYKVRRFNWFYFNGRHPNSAKSAELQRNPDVTVRTRGVMEKCTYCVQRINESKIQAKLEDRKVRDGEIKTACQQVCPSDAIAFGDINDAEARVSQWKGSPLNYGMLSELGTRPRTTYLAKLRNPNPMLEES